MTKVVLSVLIGLCAVLAACSCTAMARGIPDRLPESEQMIASMEQNQSVGNMTGDDYIIALTYAYIQDVQNGSDWMNPGPIFSSIENEALLKFPEYESVYRLLDNGLGSIDTDLEQMLLVPPNFATGKKCENLSELPESNIINTIQLVFSENEDVINTARVKYQTRIAEEAELKAMREKREAELKATQEKREAEQLREQQENEARQTALDAHYTGVFENYSIKLINLLNKSNLSEAVNLSNETIGNLVSPYSNIVMIRKGDIYSQMGMYDAAIESYKRAQTEFAYSNDSADYMKSVYQSFIEDKWDRLAEIKIGIAQQNIDAQIDAKIRDLRDAPNVKTLLIGHDHNKQYTIGVENYTYAGSGYVVFINVSAFNDPKENDIMEYIKTNIPMFIDIFGALFSDKKISYVYIQTNASYFDKFGHTQERPIMNANLDNTTAMQIGDWGAFKQYIGTDMNKFTQVINLSTP